MVDSPSVCRLCGAYCGIVVTTDGAEVVHVRGDASHPTSRGYTCVKGRAIPAFHHDPARLNHPRLGGRGVGWNDCLEDLAAALRTVRDTHGKDAVAAYMGMGTFGDRTGGAAYLGLLGLLETNQRYSAASVDIFPLWKTYELVMGYAKEANPMWEPERSPKVCLVIGQNFVVAHGYASALIANPVQRMREFRAQGGELWVLDPRRTETASLADRHLALRPDSDPFVLGWLVRELLREGADEGELARNVSAENLASLRAAVRPITIDVAAQRSGLDRRDLADLLEAVRRSGKVACVSGTGLTFGRNAMVSEWLRLALLVVTGSLDAPGGMRFPTGVVGPLHERQEWNPAPPEGIGGPGPATHPELSQFLGEYPSIALVDEIEAGNVKALIVYGGNPLTAFPDPPRIEAALRSLDVLAVVDVFDKPLTRLASHVLPAADLLEHADLVARERAAYVPAVIPPKYDRRPGWWIFAQLGRRLGLPVLKGIDLDTTTDDEVLRAMMSGVSGSAAVFDADVHGIEAPRRDGWFRAAAMPPGGWRVAPRPLVQRLAELLAEPPLPPEVFQLVPRRQAGTMNSVSYAHAPGRRRPEVPDVRLHPADADALGAGEGTSVVVASAHGSVQARVHRDSRMSPKVVSLTHGWDNPNVNRLVSQTQDIDPLSGQPRMSGLPVTVKVTDAAPRTSPTP